MLLLYPKGIKELKKIMYKKKESKKKYLDILLEL
jgi:hypothetical protein